MSQKKIYVIHSNSKIESLYTLFPLMVSRFSRLIEFLNLDSKEARKAEGECVILVRVFKGNHEITMEDQKRAYIGDFRKRFNRVIMLDDGAGSDSLHWEYMDLVDLYYKGKLLKDRSNYQKPMYGRQIFTDYYNQKYGVVDEKVKLRGIPHDPDVLNKLRVSWNLGYGMYPMPNEHLTRLAKGAAHFSLSKLLRPWFIYTFKKMVGRMNQPVNTQEKMKVVQARFSSKSLPNTIGYQRKIFLQKCQQAENILTGSIKPKAYNEEIKSVAAVLSPFGWGEVCFRDFEAVFNGSVLIKPNMDHIETWPDIYQSSKTYVPVDWDGGDLIETINQVSRNISAYRGIVEAARETYRNALLDIDNRVAHFLKETSGENFN